MPLIRANVETGALERLNVPGFSLDLGWQILGQDAEWLYITTPSGLVAVRKP